MRQMVFFNVAWMKSYEGLRRDSMRGGGAFVAAHRYGIEMFNFRRSGHRMYGAVQPSKESSINLSRLGASYDAESIKDTTVVWVARSPSGGVYIVGWYKNATVYQDYQEYPRIANRRFKGKMYGYYATAHVKDCKLLRLDQRTFLVPRGRGWMGQSNVWYCDKPVNFHFKEKVWRYVTENDHPQARRARTSNSKGYRQIDSLHRSKIEVAAVKAVWDHFEQLGYDLDDVQKRNLGYDLLARNGRKEVKIEVKGLEGLGRIVELTPNEYSAMKKFANDYRLCAVTHALSKSPNVLVFSFTPDTRRWENDNNVELNIRELTGARLSW